MIKAYMTMRGSSDIEDTPLTGYKADRAARKAPSVMRDRQMYR